MLCCRGGSKGIPGKNIKPFCGIPMLEWIVTATKETGLFDRIIISTDSHDIADVARNCGIEVPVMRPDDLAKDTSNQFDAHKHMFEYLDLNDQDHRICVLNNHPFLTTDLIKSSANLYKELNEEYICVDSVEVPVDYLFFRQARPEGNLLLPLFPVDHKKSDINRQSAAKSFSPLNNIRWGRPSQLNSYESFKDCFIKDGHATVQLPRLSNFSLDEEEDWIIAETIMEKLIEMGKFTRGHK